MDEPYAASATAQQANARVLRAWRDWRSAHELAPVEDFIAEMSESALWPAVVRFIAARLAEPDQVRLQHELRYGERVDKPSPLVLHHRFLGRVLANYDLVGVITTNYDLLAERTLRHRPMTRPSRPGFCYAGLRPQVLHGASTFSVRHGRVAVQGTIPLCKLHGSLNWCAAADELRAYADCRPAFRRNSTSYIVAPMPEKVIPLPLQPVWTVAESLLRCADMWVVVGYSAPAYDDKICEMLASKSANRALKIHVIDPNPAVAKRYHALTKADVISSPTLGTFLHDF